jgi:hypothetical protein
MIFSDEIGFIRPVTSLIDITLKKLQSSKKEAIYIGNMKSDEYNDMAKGGYYVHFFNEADEDAYQVALRYSGGYL